VVEALALVTEDQRQRLVGVTDAAIEVDLVDAVRRALDHMGIPRLAFFLPPHDRAPVALRQRVGEAVHRGEPARKEQREGQAPVAAVLLRDLDRGLDDEIARDPEYDEQLRQWRPGPRRAGADGLEVADERLVDLLALAGDREDGLEALLGLVDEAGLLGQR